MRGANRHGVARRLIGLVRHGDGVVLGQAAAPRLVAGRNLAGTITTTDALLAWEAFAARTRAHQDYYPMVVTAN